METESKEHVDKGTNRHSDSDGDIDIVGKIKFHPILFSNDIIISCIKTKFFIFLFVLQLEFY